MEFLSVAKSSSRWVSFFGDKFLKSSETNNIMSYYISKALGMNVKDFNLIKGLVLLLVFPLLALAGIVYFLDLGADPLRNLGAASAIFIFAKALALIWRRFSSRRRLRAPRSYGRWAIVTGCTGGLGQAYAHALASRGMDLLLISRNPEKLKAEATFIEGKWPKVSCKILAFDFTNTDVAIIEEFYSTLQSTLRNDLKGDIGVLVNNVGVGNEQPLYSSDLDLKLEQGKSILICCQSSYLPLHLFPF